MKVYCLRHAEAAHNVNRLINGDLNNESHITEKGKRQAKEAALKIKNIRLDAIFTSQFPRAKETAEIIAKFQDCEIKVDKRINEPFFGKKFEMNSIEFYRSERKADKFTGKEEDGESLKEVKERVYDFIESLKDQDFNNVLIVSHQDPLRFFVSYFEGLSDQEAITTRIANCQLLEFEL